MRSMPKPFTLAVFGFKNSGKTSLVEWLVSNLVKEGFKVATFKHIHHPGFTIDTKGTDTWRHAKAGANPVVSVSDGEVALILKRPTPMMGLSGLLTLIKGFDVDIVMFEGFHRVLGGSKEVYKILIARSQQELENLIPETEQPIIALVASFQPKPGLNLPAPLIMSDNKQVLLAIVKQAYLNYKAAKY